MRNTMIGFTLLALSANVFAKDNAVLPVSLLEKIVVQVKATCNDGKASQTQILGTSLFNYQMLGEVTGLGFKVDNNELLVKTENGNYEGVGELEKALCTSSATGEVVETISAKLYPATLLMVDTKFFKKECIKDNVKDGIWTGKSKKNYSISLVNAQTEEVLAQGKFSLVNSKEECKNLKTVVKGTGLAIKGGLAILSYKIFGWPEIEP